MVTHIPVSISKCTDYINILPNNKYLNYFDKMIGVNIITQTMFPIS